MIKRGAKVRVIKIDLFPADHKNIRGREYFQ